MLMNRRSFLAGASGATLAMLAGCQRPNAASLRLAMVVNSVPAQLLKAFQQLPERGSSVAVTPQESLLGLYSLLQDWHGQVDGAAPMADWVSLADYWLAPAIRQELVQPIEVAALPQWGNLNQVWTELVRRDRSGTPSPEGNIWAVPYRWGHLVVLYDPARLPRKAAQLKTWADLLRPELTRRLVLPNHPRLVLGLAQKASNVSANSADPTAVAGLDTFLAKLHQQVRTYDSDYYLESLIVGDATAVVGWSDDVLPLLRQYRHLAVAVPPEGTLLSAQLWVRPQVVPDPAPVAIDWLNFCLGNDFATQLAIFGHATSPLLWGADPQQQPEPLQTPPEIGLTPAIADQSEFLLPLTAAAEDRYSRLWRSLRT